MFALSVTIDIFENEHDLDLGPSNVPRSSENMLIESPKHDILFDNNINVIYVTIFKGIRKINKMQILNHEIESNSQKEQKLDLRQRLQIFDSIQVIFTEY